MARFWPKIWLNEGFSGNTLIFFYFLLKIFSETRTKKGGIQVFFGVKLENLWWYSLKHRFFWWSWGLGFFGEAEAFGLNSTKKNPVSMKPTHRFQVLTPKFHVKPSFFGPSFTVTVNKKKKMSGFPLKLSVRPEPRAASFNFFPAESDSFNILCQYHGFMKLAQKFQLWHWNCHKNCHFYLSVFKWNCATVK